MRGSEKKGPLLRTDTLACNNQPGAQDPRTHTHRTSLESLSFHRMPLRNLNNNLVGVRTCQPYKPQFTQGRRRLNNRYFGIIGLIPLSVNQPLSPGRLLRDGQTLQDTARLNRLRHTLQPAHLQSTCHVRRRGLKNSPQKCLRIQRDIVRSLQPDPCRLTSPHETM